MKFKTMHIHCEDENAEHAITVARAFELHYPEGRIGSRGGVVMRINTVPPIDWYVYRTPAGAIVTKQSRGKARR